MINIFARIHGISPRSNVSRERDLPFTLFEVHRVKYIYILLHKHIRLCFHVNETIHYNEMRITHVCMFLQEKYIDQLQTLCVIEEN